MKNEKNYDPLIETIGYIRNNSPQLTRERFMDELKRELGSSFSSYTNKEINNAIKKSNYYFVETAEAKEERLQKKKSRKKKGIIGTRSNETKEQCLITCNDVLVNMPSPKRTTTFYKLYEEALAIQGLPVPSKTTRLKDLKECGYEINGANILGKKEMNPRNLFGHNYGYLISQIRMVAKTYDLIIYDKKTWSAKNNRQYIDKRIHKLISDDPDTTIVRNSKLCHLYIILSEKGFEQRIANLFDTNEELTNHFSFISIHQYCVEIVFQFKEKDILLDQVYEILSYIETVDNA